MQRGSRRNRVLDRLVGTPLLNGLAVWHRRRALPQFPLRRIGVMSSPALGDTLLVSGPLQDLRSAHPEAEIVHLCMPQNLAAAEIILGADRRVLLDLTRPDQALARIRAERFDALLDFTAWQRLTAFLTLMSDAHYTVGFRTPGQGRGRGYDRTVEHARDRHELQNFRALLTASGLLPGSEVGVHEPALVPALEVSGLAGLAGAVPFAGERTLVALHPWASGQRSELREWPEASWAELARRVGSELLPGALLVVTGAPSDEGRMVRFVARLRAAGVRAEAFVSPDGFRTLTALLQRCRLVVSVNTGVMHLAAVAGAATVSLNGPTAEARWGARGRCVANVQPADGSGGYLHLGFEFPRLPADVMKRIGVEQVLAACAGLLRGCGARGADADARLATVETVLQGTANATADAAGRD